MNSRHHEPHLKTITEQIVQFIRRVVDSSQTAGVVVGLSGGVDSSVTAALCVRALGPDRVLGVLMPTEFTPEADVSDASELAKGLGIRTQLIYVQPISRIVDASLSISESDTDLRIARANILARIRMMLLYYYANSRNLLVVGTGDRSEYLLGYFTKYGDGAADFFPIQHIYKTYVRKLAIYLDLPPSIATKPSSPQLYPGHKLLDELPLDYDQLDPILIGLYDHKTDPSEIAKATNTPLPTIKTIQEKHAKSEHKRQGPSRLHSIEEQDTRSPRLAIRRKEKRHRVASLRNI